MFKNNKAITLIALTITIILLIILAGVAISTISNNGIFERAKEARDKWQNAQEEEEMQIAKYSNQINNYISSTRLLSERTVLFDGEKKNDTITFSGHTISEFTYFEFIFGIGKNDTNPRFCSEIVSIDYLNIGKNMNSNGQLIISDSQNTTYMSNIIITAVTNNSITFQTYGSDVWANNIYLYKIIGIK